MQKSVPELVKTNCLSLLGAFVSDWLVSFSGCESEATNKQHGSSHGKVECLFAACMRNLTSAFDNFKFDNGPMITNLLPHPLTMGYCQMLKFAAVVSVVSFERLERFSAQSLVIYRTRRLSFSISTLPG